MMERWKEEKRGGEGEKAWAITLDVLDDVYLR